MSEQMAAIWAACLRDDLSDLDRLLLVQRFGLVSVPLAWGSDAAQLNQGERLMLKIWRDRLAEEGEEVAPPAADWLVRHRVVCYAAMLADGPAMRLGHAPQALADGDYWELETKASSCVLPSFVV